MRTQVNVVSDIFPCSDHTRSGIVSYHLNILSDTLMGAVFPHKNVLLCSINSQVDGLNMSSTQFINPTSFPLTVLLVEIVLQARNDQS